MNTNGYCTKCGQPLILKHLENEGEIPYCNSCGEFRFKMFNVAISTIVYHPDGDKIALIQQYGKKNNILIAGYVNIGESTEAALQREVKEELGLHVEKFQFNASEYFAPSNTLMVNFACMVNSADLTKINDEIDDIHWFTVEEAKANILHDSLAEKFLLRWLEKQES